MYTDAMAGLLMDFGYTSLDKSIEHHRERATNFRPSIRDLRDQCELHKPFTRRPQSDREHEAYLRDIQIHPEKYIPVNFFLNAAVQVGEQRKREKFGNEEAKRRISALVEAQRVEWLVEVRKHQAADRKTVGAGA